MKTFGLSAEDMAKVNAWLKDTVYPPMIAEQKALVAENPLHFGGATEIVESCWEDGEPYGGAISGAVTYSFTPTSLGVVAKVSAYGQELDLTQYDMW